MHVQTFSFRRSLLSACLGVSLWGVGGAALASNEGPIRILVGFPAGGTIDIVARQLAEQMNADLGVTVAVETMTGAGGQLAAQALKRAAPDGRTLMLAPDHTMVILPLTVAKPGFDVKKDFTPISLVANYAGGLAVSQASGINTLSELIARGKTDPAGVSVGISAPGSKPYFQLEALSKQLKTSLTPVPYRGSVPIVQDVSGGHLLAGITALGDFLEFHRAGKLKVIAVTGGQRAQAMPDVPTAQELGYAMDMDFWVGLFAPAGTPAAVIERLNQSVGKALATSKMRDRLTPLAFEAAGSTPAALSQRIDAEAKQWEPLVTESGWVKQ